MNWTTDEWIDRLERAKVLALTKYRSVFRIGKACAEVGIWWDSALMHSPTAKVSQRPVYGFLRDNGNTRKNVAAVFDASIAKLKAEKAANTTAGELR